MSNIWLTLAPRHVFGRILIEFNYWKQSILGPSASCDDIILWFGCSDQWLQSLVLILLLNPSAGNVMDGVRKN